jgi:hypothetical protein
MTTPYVLPLDGVNETFRINLSGVSYGFQVIWRDDPCGMGGWFIDISDPEANPLVQGIPLVTGIDLLAQYGYLGFTGSLYVLTAQDPMAPPTFDNLGTDSNLYWVTNP